MEDEVTSSEQNPEDMGVVNNPNPNASRLLELQEQKKQREEALAKHNQELRELCFQEAELTGKIPPEMPLEEGETLPQIPRRIVTAYQFNESHVRSTNRQIDELEMHIEVLQKMAEASLGLCQTGSSRSIRRRRLEDYKSKQSELVILKQRLAELKEHVAAAEVKQKKKSRVPTGIQDDISLMTNDPVMLRHENRHSQSLNRIQHNLQMDANYPDQRYSLAVSRSPHRNSDTNFSQCPKPEDSLTSRFYRLSLNGFSEYEERNDGTMQSAFHYSHQAHSNAQSYYDPNYYTMHQNQQYPHGSHMAQKNLHSPFSQNNPFPLLRSQQIPMPQLQGGPMPQHGSIPHHSPLSHHSPSSQYCPMPQQGSSPHYSVQYGHMAQHGPRLQHSPVSQQCPMPPHPHITQHSPISQHSQLSQHSPMSQHPHLAQHSPVSQHSQLSQHSPMSQHSPQMSSHSPQTSQSPVFQSRTGSIHRPGFTNSANSIQIPQPNRYNTVHGDNFNRYPADNQSIVSTTPNTINRNPHQIQPHQQYENISATTAGGLGGSWKRTETGEWFWCYENIMQRDRRFGSLDRRRNKRLHVRASPSDDKSATIATMPSHNDTAFVKPSEIRKKSGYRSQDRQLTRTQSLGSVGHILDNVCQSDDTSSCESDNHSLKGNQLQVIRKHKEKEWMETSLDGPISPTPSNYTTVSRSHSTVSSIPGVLAPEEKYLEHSSSSNNILTSSTPPNLLQISSQVSHPMHQNHTTHSPTLDLLLVSENRPVWSPIGHVPKILSPLTPKSMLEIPAESNPSPRVPEQPNMEFLNNNILENCTVIQAGGFKPYQEETKPFEMSDFYKYSTKYNKSPGKNQNNTGMNSSQHGGAITQRNLNESYENHHKNLLQNQPHNMRPERYNMHSTHQNAHTVAASRDTMGNMNNSLDFSQISVSDHFSAEMNAWYNGQDHNNQNNNANGNENASNATLV